MTPDNAIVLSDDVAPTPKPGQFRKGSIMHLRISVDWNFMEDLPQPLFTKAMHTEYGSAIPT